MPRILALRHAQSAWNVDGRWQGWADPPLSPGGEAQAALAGARLRQGGARFAVAASSDLARARRTAEILADALAIAAPLRVLPGLREYDVGAWSGLRRPDIARQWPDELALWERGELAATPGGEDLAAFDARVAGAFDELVASAGPPRAADGAEADVLLVAHGGVVRSLIRRFGGVDRPVRHLSGVWLDPGNAAGTLGDDVELVEARPTAPASAGGGDDGPVGPR